MAKSKLIDINRKIEKVVIDGYKKIEDNVVESYTKLEDKFVESYLIHDGEHIADAKKRLNQNKNK